MKLPQLTSSDIKHVSFDVWNTLITSSQSFPKARFEVIMGDYELPRSFTQSFITSYRYVKHTLDTNAENAGTALSTTEIYQMLAAAVGVSKTKGQCIALKTKIHKLFEEHPPVLSEDTIKSLIELSDNGFTISIGSNSNFISGSVMYPFLKSHIPSLRFGVFSDLELVSKPHPCFFDSVIQQARECNKDAITPSNILHVGDNAACDGYGPIGVGMNSWLISSPSDIPQLTKELITYGQCITKFVV